MGKVLVVGSINMDLVFSTPDLPKAGQTVPASFATYPGGKGANQAVAAARLGVETAMIGCVGEDSRGQELLDSLKSNGVDTKEIGVYPGPTGCAGIFVSKAGENSIAVAPGANELLTPDKLEDSQFHGDVLLLQLEVPVETVLAAAKLAHNAGMQVVLDPAPVREIPQELYALIDFITPNAHEASELTGIDVHCWKTAALAARVLRDKGVTNVIVTMGKFGAFFSSPQGEVRISAPQVETVDTTAAGDAFNGALAAALSHGMIPDEAADIAACAGALATRVPGAQPSLPAFSQLAEVIKLPWQK